MRDTPYKAVFTPTHEWNANANDAYGREPRQNVWYIRTLLGIRRSSKSTIRMQIPFDVPTVNG